ncbi:MAG: hypothetical protein OEW60_08895, partial [Thiovulaceae bacterium]|nr:hypothetical protein [Sulfurimonadaceae bacterium]
YSDAMLFIRDDGNGFTENSVFSYWDDKGELKIEKAKFSDIAKVEPTYSEDMLSNTIATVVRNDGSSFTLYISSEDGLDKKFVEELKKQWQKSKKL